MARPEFRRPACLGILRYFGQVLSGFSYVSVPDTEFDQLTDRALTFT